MARDFRGSHLRIGYSGVLVVEPDQRPAVNPACLPGGGMNVPLSDGTA
jgi:hypothetical protein